MNILITAFLILLPSAHAATGRTGPVGLELNVLKTKLKVGEPLFVKTTIKNYSKDWMPVVDWIYRGANNLGEEWFNHLITEVGTTLEVEDSRGRRVKPVLVYLGEDINSPFDKIITSASAEEKKLLRGWEAEGLTSQQAIDRLNEKFRMDEKKQRDARYPSIRLEQGQSATSVSWCAARDPKPEPLAVTCPGGGFVEMPFFEFDRPGRYRIRAVDNSVTPKDLMKWTTPWSVRVATNWIDFEVSK